MTNLESVIKDYVNISDTFLKYWEYKIFYKLNIHKQFDLNRMQVCSIFIAEFFDLVIHHQILQFVPLENSTTFEYNCWIEWYKIVHASSE